MGKGSSQGRGPQHEGLPELELSLVYQTQGLTIHTPDDYYLDLEANDANTEEEVQDDDEALQGILSSINSDLESE